MTLTASSCGEEDDNEDDNSICMLWHLHLVINILSICFAAAYRFPQIRLTKLKDVQIGTPEKNCVCVCDSPWLLMKDE